MKCKFCPQDADYEILGVCKQCYGALAYWKGRSQRDKRNRAAQVAKFAKRMAHLIEHPRQVPRKRKR